MKSKVKELIIILVAVLLTACGKKTVSPDTPYVIEGELTGVRDSVVIRLSVSDTGGSTRIATDTIINGKFRFENVMQEPEQNKLSLMVIDPDFPPMLCRLYTAPGAHIKIKGNGTHLVTWDVQSDVPEQIEYNKLTDFARDEYDEVQALQIELSKKRSESFAIDRVAQPELYNTIRDEYNELVKRNNELNAIIEQKKVEQMKKMQPSAPWFQQLYAMALSAGSEDDYPYREDAIALYQSMSEEMKQSTKGKEIYANLFPPKSVVEGDATPDADFFDLDGNLHHLSEFKGKYMLLDFWSIGCGYCIVALPEMKQMHEQYADRLAIVSLNVDNDARWRRASKEHEITWNNWNEGKGMGGLSVNYRVSGIPHYVLLNPEGIVERQIVGYEEGMFQTLFTELFDGK